MKRIRITGKAKHPEPVFWEILLEEKYVGERFLVSREALRSVGGINKKLAAKADYELLLRLSAGYSLAVDDLTEAAEEGDPEETEIFFPRTADSLSELETDCYIAGKYKEELLGAGYFNDMVESILYAAEEAGKKDAVLACLEQMLTRAESYYGIDDAVLPVLIYKGEDICHNVLNVFAEAFGRALLEAGQSVSYYDMTSRPIGEIAELAGKRYKAIVGFQTYAFTIQMKGGDVCLHNLIAGKKFNFIFDHPIWLLPHLMHSVEDFCVLSHDRNYIAFIEKYYHKKAYLLPPAGIVQEGVDFSDGKKYDLSFVGTYGNYLNEILLIHAMERKTRFLANAFLLKMRKNPDLTAEHALTIVLKDRGIILQEEEFLRQFYELRRVIYCVMHYYRHRVLKTILDAGIRIDVFGDSWKSCPLRGYDHLICHPDVTVEESLMIWRQSKLSLNIMSWHKDGFTERIANSMLAGAVVITDQSDYLKEHFEDGEEIVLFGLGALEELPGRIRALLEDDALRRRIAGGAYEKAMREHTWRSRAEEFLKWI